MVGSPFPCGGVVKPEPLEESQALTVLHGQAQFEREGCLSPSWAQLTLAPVKQGALGEWRDSIYIWAADMAFADA